MKDEKMISVKLTLAQIERITQVMPKLGGINRSIFIRQAIEEKLQRTEKE